MRRNDNERTIGWCDNDWDGCLCPPNRQNLGSMPPIELCFIKLEHEFDLDFDSITFIHDDASPLYEGDYEVTPRVFAQTLETSGKRMNDNVQIEPIPYYTVSNEQNGLTVIIGG